MGYYWEAKVLLTSVKLDIYTCLSGGGRTASELSRHLGSDTTATTRLLDALAALGLLVKEADRYRNTPAAQEFLVATSPSYAGNLLLLQESEWENWGKLEETVRSGRSPVRENVFLTHPEMARNVTLVLHRIGLQSAPGLAKVVDLSDCRTLLDLGGGAGTYSVFLCRAYPQLKAAVFDLPNTLHTAQKIIEEFGMEKRITLIAGDFRKDDLKGPRGTTYDAVFMSDVIHYQEPEENRKLVKKVYDCLTEKGRVIIKDKFLNEGGTSPAWTAVFGVHLLVHTEKGQCYTVEEAKRWLEEAGFSSIQELEHTALLSGRK